MSRTMSIPRSMNNKSTFVTLGFNQYQTLTELTSGEGRIARYRLNSAYDPTPAIASNQPLGFDQYTNIFQRYLVYGGNWEVHIGNQLTTGPGLAVVGCWVTTENDVPATATMWSSTNGAQSKLISSSSGGPSVAVFKGKINIARAFGVPKKNIWVEENYEANINANPTNQLFLNVFTIGQGATTSFVTIHTKIYMKIRFSGRRSLIDTVPV